MNLKVILIDDEIDGTTNLELAITSITNRFEIIRKFNNPERAIDFLQENEVDIVFLDINMPEISGFELLERLPTQEFQLVFVTAFEQHALKAFDYSAVDYILKPIDDEYLEKVIQKLIETFDDFISEQTNLGQVSEDVTSDNTRFVINTTGKITIKELNDISYLVASGSYTDLYLNDRTKVTIGKILKDFDAVLSDHLFFRIHHGTLVNIRSVTEFNTKESQLTLKNGEMLTVSMRKKTKFIQALNSSFLSTINI
jgi:two-component system LytT family response regulator